MIDLYNEYHATDKNGDVSLYEHRKISKMYC